MLQMKPVQVVLVGQRLTLFDFNWGTTTVPYPAPIAAMVALGSNLVNCISSSVAHLRVSHVCLKSKKPIWGSKPGCKVCL